MIRTKSPSAIAKMREAGLIVHTFLQRAREITKPGISTYDYDLLAEEICKEFNCEPSFLGYNGFIGRTCISVNEEIIHGIPSKNKILQDGDLVSIDFGAYKNGYHGDSAISVIVGDVAKAKSKNIEKLYKVTQESLYKGIEVIKPGIRLGLVSSTIQKYVESHGFGVVREFVGHGIGESLHEEPQVPNFGSPESGPRLKKGMTIAIEPMVVEKSIKVKVLDDDWTAVTADGGLACHFEHTVLVTDSGYEILTKP